METNFFLPGEVRRIASTISELPEFGGDMTVRYQDGPQQKCKFFFLEGRSFDVLHPYLHCWVFLMIFVFPSSMEGRQPDRQAGVKSLQGKICREWVMPRADRYKWLHLQLTKPILWENFGMLPLPALTTTRPIIFVRISDARNKL